MSFYFYHSYSKFLRNIDFFYKNSLDRPSADCDQSGFVTFFHASLDVKRYQFALLIFGFVIAVCVKNFCFERLRLSHSGRYLKDCL